MRGMTDVFVAVIIPVTVILLSYKGCEAEIRDADMERHIQRLELRIDALELGRNVE